MDTSVGQQLIAAFGTSNPYEILQVESIATAEVIKKAYRKAALKNHPDKGGDSEKFKACCVSYNILSDTEKRASTSVSRVDAFCTSASA